MNRTEASATECMVFGDASTLAKRRRAYQNIQTLFCVFFLKREHNNNGHSGETTIMIIALDLLRKYNNSTKV